MIRFNKTLPKLSLAFFAIAPTAHSEEITSSWEDIAAIVFEERLMLNGEEWIDAKIPYRTENDLRQNLGASVRSPDQTAIKSLYLVIDENPMPVSLVMHPESEITHLSFNASFRIDRPTNTHLVMELADGRIFMEENYIKTSGIGACAAAPVNDPDEALATIGNMALKLAAPSTEDQLKGANNNLEINISHPQNSGMQMNQITLLYIPARYVTELNINNAQAPWLRVEGSISLAENPSLSFEVPENEENWQVNLKDSDGLSKDAEI